MTVWQWGSTVEREAPRIEIRLAIARHTVRMHTDPVGEGRCKACPDDDAEMCPAFKCAIRRLLDAGGIPYLYRFA